MSSSPKPEIDKGGAAEEHLRSYFIAQGCFVVRGAKLRYAGFDVTDVDLFLYSRASLYSRERAIVDIKNKRTPQAMERVLWAKGLMGVLRCDRAFVATTDDRDAVTSFGANNEVTILNGAFLRRLISVQASQTATRISEEQFLREMEHGSVGKLGGDWRGVYEESKSRLIARMEFDQFNYGLEVVRIGLEAMPGRDRTTPATLRFLYVLISHLLLTFDFISRRMPPLEADERRDMLTDGFRYGDSGKERSEQLVSFAASIATAVGGKYKGIAGTLKDEIVRQYSEIPVEILADHLAKAALLKTALDLASAFEREAFSKSPIPIAQLSAEQQAMVGVLCDFYRLDRKLVFA